MTESAQHWLQRMRPPKVRVTYEVETGGAVEVKEIPFLVGVFANLSGDREAGAIYPPDYASRRMTPIDRDNFDDVMRSIGPRVSLSTIAATLPDSKADEMLVGDIKFASMADFEPLHLVRAVPSMDRLYQLRIGLRRMQAKAEASGVFNAAAIEADRRVAEIDQILSQQLSAILHAKSFQEVEATWRGLYYLVSHTETSATLKLSVFNATSQELSDDMDKAAGPDQSYLFKLLYEAGYGSYGDQPYSLLMGDYKITRSNKDMQFLTCIARLAASVHAPYIAAADADLFGLQSFGDLSKPRALAKIFESVDLAAWQEFRQSEDARYVTLVLPHVLLRLPYGQQGQAVEGMVFDEAVHDADKLPNQGHFLWGNAAYMLAQRVANAFALYHWPMAICGVEGGGLVEGLPLYSHRNQTDVDQLVCPTEVAITDSREKELSELGFTPLCYRDGTASAAFFGGQTTQLPKKYFNDLTDANAHLASGLPCMLAASRFAHYIKMIMRAKVGSFMTRANVESYLNTWISQYALLGDNASQEAKASYPLRQAGVVVTDVPGEPGSYQAALLLRLHFQIEELNTSIRLVVNLPA